MYGTLKDSITLGLSEPETNGSEGALHTLQISRTESSQSDAI